MVIGDLGCVEIADPHVRLQKKLRLGDNNIYVCTPNYGPPDVWLGSQQYQEDLDMWSFGCVAAEVYSRDVLIVPAATAKQAPCPKQFFRSHRGDRAKLKELVAAIVPSFVAGRTAFL